MGNIQDQRVDAEATEEARPHQCVLEDLLEHVYSDRTGEDYPEGAAAALIAAIEVLDREAAMG